MKWFRTRQQDDTISELREQNAYLRHMIETRDKEIEPLHAIITRQDQALEDNRKTVTSWNPVSETVRQTNPLQVVHTYVSAVSGALLPYIIGGVIALSTLIWNVGKGVNVEDGRTLQVLGMNIGTLVAAVFFARQVSKRSRRKSKWTAWAEANISDGTITPIEGRELLRKRCHHLRVAEGLMLFGLLIMVTMTVLVTFWL